VLVLDELGYLPATPDFGPVLYEIVAGRYERRPTWPIVKVAVAVLIRPCKVVIAARVPLLPLVSTSQAHARPMRIHAHRAPG